MVDIFRMFQNQTVDGDVSDWSRKFEQLLLHYKYAYETEKSQQ
jgi:hypothetical protein